METQIAEHEPVAIPAIDQLEAPELLQAAVPETVPVATQKSSEYKVPHAGGEVHTGTLDHAGKVCPYIAALLARAGVAEATKKLATFDVARHMNMAEQLAARGRAKRLADESASQSVPTTPSLPTKESTAEKAAAQETEARPAPIIPPSPALLSKRETEALPLGSVPPRIEVEAAHLTRAVTPLAAHEPPRPRLPQERAIKPSPAAPVIAETRPLPPLPPSVALPLQASSPKHSIEPSFAFPATGQEVTAAAELPSFDKPNASGEEMTEKEQAVMQCTTEAPIVIEVNLDFQATAPETDTPGDLAMPIEFADEAAEALPIQLLSELPAETQNTVDAILERLAELTSHMAILQSQPAQEIQSGSAMREQTFAAAEAPALLATSPTAEIEGTARAGVETEEKVAMQQLELCCVQLFEALGVRAEPAAVQMLALHLKAALIAHRPSPQQVEEAFVNTANTYVDPGTHERKRTIMAVAWQHVTQAMQQFQRFLAAGRYILASLSAPPQAVI